MSAIFFLIRIPIFLIALLVLLAVGVIGTCFTVCFGLPLALGAGMIWAFILAPLAFIFAAVENKPETFKSFLKESEEWFTEVFETMVLPIFTTYLNAYPSLFKWLVGESPV
jgi:hypothetical protein